ncbi:hypothetical protein E4Q46_23425, partial [Salmonella enterica]|nr:hypothetical protein [Salmonella enterica]EAQ3033436.1 hypothetical protein [Salmonella enterica]ECD3736539.1 hypothetical protein [Salmonella enterica subsp. enterica serovar Stanley]EDA9521321.1 hypothetical protein [Salmonella enterica subsp. enterica serovar Kentucky]EKI9899062.1 hypothetical protein [Salmonella enterica subsp. enterica]
MAVENKFKLNVLAASVLMGLSLSTSGVAWADDINNQPQVISESQNQSDSSKEADKVDAIVNPKKNEVLAAETKGDESSGLVSTLNSLVQSGKEILGLINKDDPSDHEKEPVVSPDSSGKLDD